MKALWLALLVVACSSGGPPKADLSGPNGVCAKQAEDSPEVRSLRMKGAGSPEFYANHQGELTEAQRQAELRCLRQLGLAPPGGVQAPARQTSSFLGFF